MAAERLKQDQAADENSTALVVKGSRRRAPGRGSKPGERRGGRQPGTPNKATASLRDAAAEYTADSLQVLADIMNDPKLPAAARVSAAVALLDRGHGKPSQAVEVSADTLFVAPSLAHFYGRSDVQGDDQ